MAVTVTFAPSAKATIIRGTTVDGIGAVPNDNTAVTVPGEEKKTVEPLFRTVVVAVSVFSARIAACLAAYSSNAVPIFQDQDPKRSCILIYWVADCSSPLLMLSTSDHSTLIHVQRLTLEEAKEDMEKRMKRKTGPPTFDEERLWRVLVPRVYSLPPVVAH